MQQIRSDSETFDTSTYPKGQCSFSSHITSITEIKLQIARNQQDSLCEDKQDTNKTYCVRTSNKPTRRIV